MKIISLTIIICVISYELQAQNWTAVGSGVNGPVASFYNDTASNILYAGGYFTSAGGNAANHIAAWDGITWSPLGNGVNNFPVSCITKYNGEIYAAGVFDSAGNVKAKNIARWNGTAWSKLAGGTNSWVKSMAVFNNELYVAGWFTTANSIAVNYIAKWDGSNWSTLGSGLNDWASALQVYNGKLYVGGAFSMAGGIAAYYIAAWDGSNWSAVGNGLSDNVNSMAVLNGNLYINYGANTAVWNGIYLSAWSGVTKDNNSMCMITDDTSLYIGGHFTMVGNNSFKYITKWNQVTWSSIGSGMSYGGVFGMAIYDNELYAGGWFDSAGSNYIPYIAKWSLLTSIDDNTEYVNNNINAFPNPFQESTLISFRSDDSEASSLIIYNCLGIPVRIYRLQNIHNGDEIKVRVFANDLKAGIYYAVVENHESRRFKKIIVTK